MKKSIVILLFVFCMVLLISCTSNEPNVDVGNDTPQTQEVQESETAEEPKKEEPIRLSKEEQAKLYKYVEFELPENFRDAMVDYMRKCSDIKWVAENDFSMVQDNESWTVGLSYTKGTQYQGIPYTDYDINYGYFEALLKDGKYYPSAFGWRESPGLSCYSSIMAAHQQFDPYEGPVKSWIPGQEGFWMVAVGGYEVKEPTTVTQEICEQNGKDTMFDAYASLRKGDIVYDMNDIATYNMHLRVVVEDPTLAKTAAGKVIPSRSYITTIEQTNAFDKSRTDGVNTTWYVDHQYTFDNLYSKGYIPLSLKSYDKPLSEMEVPYIGLDTEITSSVLEKGIVQGMVKSNFPLVYVRVQILDKSGNVVLSQEKGELHKVYKFTLRKEFPDVFSNLENGEYTFVLTAGIAPGNVEFARVDFTYNK